MGSSRGEWAALDLNGEFASGVGSAGPPPESFRAGRAMSEDMSENMSEKNVRVYLKS